MSSQPPVIKRGTCLVPFGWIAGRAYRETMARHNLFDRATRKEILSYQEKKLGEVLRFATEQVPAYRHLRSAVEDSKPFQVLEDFPLLDKETLMRDFNRYIPTDIAWLSPTTKYRRAVQAESNLFFLSMMFLNLLRMRFSIASGSVWGTRSRSVGLPFVA